MNQQNTNDVTRDLRRGTVSRDEAVAVRHAERIGRYRIRKVLGKGGFGIVYLAYDEELSRHVAVKVPHSELISQPADAKAYLTEARTVANLDDPHIVPVYDIGSTDDCPCYVVSKYIEGTDLATMLKQQRFHYRDAAELVATVAESLGYAHKQGLVHRDIKPGNILIGKNGEPQIVDFGLALREENVGSGPKYAGTPAYMSPEQARGEGHRVDGRSDIFSLGVVFYELLIGRQPFRGDTQAELFEKITCYEPRPIRQYDEKLPKELERICQTAMSKRASERYSSAHDFAEDLRHFLADQKVIRGVTGSGMAGSSSAGAARSETPATTPALTMADCGDRQAAPADSGSSFESQLIRIVPKGLRSFDAHDADFFLELLPGPRDRGGLPDSLRFWKTRIEETDPDDTFSVGLIYGPSGCGKSSLVKAGLLPRLSNDVIRVYVEATPEDTETRLLHGLLKQCPAMDDSLNLKETLAALRRGQGIPAGKKVLIVLDQFEQWLHAKKEEENTDLVQALRQCDGGRVQCIVMVRDDFWLAVSRFLRELEIRLVEGHNIALADLFDLHHARKVLAAFGRAFGKLPENIGEMTSEQKDFLKQSIAGLSEEGKVICVRLALFAEMMKGKSWTSTTLRQVGGTRGIGITFLEETFSSSTASPEHRYHQKAARAVLKSLLPASGTNIKGEMKSYAELLEASGYAHRTKDFDDLVKILDSEIRLITPTDPEGVEPDDLSDSRVDVGQKYYQLTHDFLVPSLRDWLTRKQRETRRGRAEIRLAELSALWSAKPENRRLPNVLEWINIRCWTDAKRWNEPQRCMMRKAARVQLAIWGTAVAGILFACSYAAVVRHKDNVEQTKLLVLGMRAAQGAAVPVVAKALDQLPQEMVLQELRSQHSNAPSREAKLSLAYGLAHFGEVDIDTILEGLDEADIRGSEVTNIVAALQIRKEDALGELRRSAASASDRQNWEFKSRLAIVAWHLGDASIAIEMLKAFPDSLPAESELPLQRWDPIERTTFIASFSEWSGDLEKLVSDAVRDSKIADFRSGVSLALGSVDPVSEAANGAWKEVLADWGSKAPDSGTHSAAGWALKQWGIPPPVATRGRDWWRAEKDLTMVKIRAGNVQGKKDDGEAYPIKVSKAFWLGDREITVGLFSRFIEDDRYEGPKPADWSGPVVFSELSGEAQFDHPVQLVRWYDAVMFCNWLSEKHGLDLCYEIEADPKRASHYKVALIAESNGFRLPTENEWEFACRAMTTTAFSFGEDERDLHDYGVYEANSNDRTEPVCSLRCNAWGLFDMHGNVWEWCDQRDGPLRVFRGGCWKWFGRYCRSSKPYSDDPDDSFDYLGFRVAASMPVATMPGP